jgi:hypothetical protein
MLMRSLVIKTCVLLPHLASEVEQLPRHRRLARVHVPDKHQIQMLTRVFFL